MTVETVRKYLKHSEAKAFMGAMLRHLPGETTKSNRYSVLKQYDIQEARIKFRMLVKDAKDDKQFKALDLYYETILTMIKEGET